MKRPREWWVRVNKCARITSGFMTEENPYDSDAFQWVEKSEGDEIIKVVEITEASNPSTVERNTA